MTVVKDETEKVTLNSKVVFHNDSGELALKYLPHHLIIPETVDGLPVKILGKSLYEGGNFRSVRFPETITHIKDRAFSINNFDSLELPESLVSIGDYAFASSGLKDLVLGDNLTHIGSSAFINNKLTFIEIPNSVGFIGKYAFKDNKLESVIIPASVKTIMHGAFENNREIMRLHVERGSVAERYAMDNELKYELMKS